MLSSSASSLYRKRWSVHPPPQIHLNHSPHSGNDSRVSIHEITTYMHRSAESTAASAPLSPPCKPRESCSLSENELGRFGGHWRRWRLRIDKNGSHSCTFRAKESSNTAAICPRVIASCAPDSDKDSSEGRKHLQKLGLSLATLAATAIVANLSPLPTTQREDFGIGERSQDTAELAIHKSYIQASFWDLFRVGSAQANGLLRMPPQDLRNTYYLVRAGESEKESLGILYTNPVGKTSMDSGLSAKGKLQTLAAARELQRMGACQDSCWVWPSITQRAYQTAEIISAINKVPYSRIVPEYSFLDARSVGAFEGKGLDALDEVHALDAVNQRLRPPPFYDGTPNESVADVLVRVVQLMSILETQYFGDTVIIVSPDSDNLSVLSAALTGLDLRSHTTLSFAPGEVRMVDLSGNRVPTPNFSGYIPCPKPPTCN